MRTTTRNEKETGGGSGAKRKAEIAQIEKDFEDALRLDPQNPIGYSARGAVYLAKGYSDLAINDFNMCLKLNPNDADSYAMLALSHWYNKRDSEKTLEYANRALELNPNSAEAYFAIANTYFYQSDYNEARANCEKALGADPDYEPAKSLLLYIKQKLREEELAALKKAYYSEPVKPVEPVEPPHKPPAKVSIPFIVLAVAGIGVGIAVPFFFIVGGFFALLFVFRFARIGSITAKYELEYKAKMEAYNKEKEAYPAKKKQYEDEMKLKAEAQSRTKEFLE